MTKNDYIQYWVAQAEESWKSANSLLKNKRYMMAVFCWHLTIEKLLKANWVKNNEGNHPPRTHNLTFIHDEAKLNLDNDMQAELKVINAWNIEGRYPDYQNNLFKAINKKYIDGKIKTIKEIKKCLQKNLQ